MYKSGQGYWTRTMTSIAAGVLACFAGVWLGEELRGRTWGAIEPIYVAATVGVIVVAICGAIIYWLVGVKPGSVDFLIATEAEMKKVNWSTRREIFGSTWVVIVLTALITVYVFAFDQVFAFVFTWMKVLDAGI
ncbi:MAG TPA: preprotein translocase subunit SecE [Phycisphaerales bacterium]|nr:preprotein translocase subunit SecE [Phycisphaerales bacterium]HMP38027.1 preprotein translocase subunit SecE [Phycisphaerales bacterium]